MYRLSCEIIQGQSNLFDGMEREECSSPCSTGSSMNSILVLAAKISTRQQCRRTLDGLGHLGKLLRP